MKFSSRVILNTTSLWGVNLLQAGIGIVLVPFLLIKLGMDVYGIVIIIGVIVTLSDLLDFGFRSGLARHLCAANSLKDYREFNRLFSTGILLYVTLGLTTAFILWLLAPVIVPAFKISENLQVQSIFLVRYYGGVMVLIAFLSPAFSSVMLAHNRFDIQNLIQGVSQLFRGVFLITILSLSNLGLYGYVIVDICVQVIRLVVLIIMVRRYHPMLRINPCLFNYGSLHKLFTLGGKMFLFNLSRYVSLKADPIVLTMFLGPVAVALYRPGTQLATLVRNLVNSMRSQIWAIATSSHETGDKERLEQILIFGTRYTILMGSIASIFLIIFSSEIMKLWISDTPIGEKYIICAWIVAFWAIADLFDYFGGTQWGILLGMNRLSFLSIFSIFTGTINIIASIVLVKYTDFGVIGVVVPTAVISIIRRPVIFWHCISVVGINPQHYFRSAYLKPMIVLLLVMAFAVMFRLAMPSMSILELIVALSSLSLIWLCACWCIGFDEADRILFRSLTAKAYGIFQPKSI